MRPGRHGMGIGIGVGWGGGGGRGEGMASPLWLKFPLFPQIHNASRQTIHYE